MRSVLDDPGEPRRQVLRQFLKFNKVRRERIVY